MYVEVSYAGDRRNYILASDDSAKDLSVTSVSKTVLSCAGGPPCTLEEVVGIDVADATLRERAASGYPIKLMAQSGDAIIIVVSPAQIALQLAAVDKYIKDPAAAALAVPVGGAARDVEFGVDQFGEPWGMNLRADAKRLGLPSPYEALVVHIRSGSIAQKAGLKWADGIYEFDSQPITSTQNLLELIRSVPAGKLVEFKVVRIDKSVTLQAQF